MTIGTHSTSPRSAGAIRANALQLASWPGYASTEHIGLRDRDRLRDHEHHPEDFEK